MEQHGPTCNSSGYDQIFICVQDTISEAIYLARLINTFSFLKIFIFYTCIAFVNTVNHSFRSLLFQIHQIFVSSFT